MIEVPLYGVQVAQLEEEKIQLTGQINKLDEFSSCQFYGRVLVCTGLVTLPPDIRAAI